MGALILPAMFWRAPTGVAVRHVHFAPLIRWLVAALSPRLVVQVGGDGALGTIVDAAASRLGIATRFVAAHATDFASAEFAIDAVDLLAIEEVTGPERLDEVLAA